MTEPGSFLAAASAEVATILGESAAAADAFAAASGIRCREGCGQCCLKPGVEAMPVELLPLAAALLADGTAAAVYDRAAADASGVCVFYAPQTGDATLGRCSQYKLRPSLCRLFGFAAISGKDGGAPALAACHWHKKLQPEAVAEAQAKIAAGAEVPLFSEYSLRLRMVAPLASLTTRLPLNQALMQAIEKLSLDALSQA